MSDSPHDLTLRCRCGGLALVARAVRPAVANRIACHCEGCLAFARRMDPGALDAHGGVERVQVSPGCLALRAGAERLACMQQTPRGALRWVASCCATPLGLTLRTPRVPFVGLDVARVDGSALAVPLERVIGPLRARVNSDLRGEQAKALRADPGSLLGMLGHLAPLTLAWWWRGEHRRSPFFLRTGEPAAPVERLYPHALLSRRAARCR